MRDLNSLDIDFKNKVAERPGGEGVLNCYLCGTCTAGCPISELNKEYNPRRIMRMILLGMKDDVLSSPEIWQCTQCHTCVAHCPQNVRFADVLRVVREMAVEQGFVKKDFVEKIDKLDLELKQSRIDKVKELTKL